MKRLIEQILKFGVVGILAFLLDWAILNVLVGFFHWNNVRAGALSCVVSLAFNYLLSMRFIFNHREDMARWMEMLIFFVAAVIGLMFNEIIIWMSTYGMNHDAMVTQQAEYLLRTNIGKFVASAVVGVWNFVIRKWLLDNDRTDALNSLRTPGRRLTQEELDARWESSFAHRLGRWSLEHTPKGWSRS